MANTHPIRCRCGRFQAELARPELGTRGVCYCRDCQAFAHFLGSPGDVLDASGGTEVVAVRPRNVSFIAGVDQLACMSLTTRGMLRWYAQCCRTPIGNTPRNFAMSHLGVIHTCLESTGRSVDDAFGPVRMWLNPQSAKGETGSGSNVTFAVAILRYFSALAWSRLSGKYRTTPFFDTTGRPRVQPYVLSEAEHDELMRSV